MRFRPVIAPRCEKFSLPSRRNFWVVGRRVAWKWWWGWCWLVPAWPAWSQNWSPLIESEVSPFDRTAVHAEVGQAFLPEMTQWTENALSPETAIYVLISKVRHTFLQNHLFDWKCYRGPLWDSRAPQIYPDEFAIFVASKTLLLIGLLEGKGEVTFPVGHN